MNSQHLEIEVARLQAENRKLRAALKVNGRHSRRIQRAYDCALLLATWHVAYLPTSREFAAQNGMAQRQWENAIALLRLAHSIDSAGQWLIHDLPTINAKLEDAVIAANLAPTAYFAYGNQHMQS